MLCLYFSKEVVTCSDGKTKTTAILSATAMPVRVLFSFRVYISSEDFQSQDPRYDKGS